MSDVPAVILIAGTSHVGKTTLATRIGTALDWRILSTDGLGRHPGRPWPEPRPQVAEFYERLTDDTIYWFLEVHHQNMAEGLMRRVEEAKSQSAPMVLEGSALRPDVIARLASDRVAAICLWVASDVLRDRVQRSARYDSLEARARFLVDRFLARSLRDNDVIRSAAEKCGLAVVDTADLAAVGRAADDLIHWARPLGQ